MEAAADEADHGVEYINKNENAVKISAAAFIDTAI